MPKLPNFVIVLGDVSNPGAVQHREGRSVREYVSDAGGTQFSADKGRIYVVYPNGLAKPVKSSVWRRSNVAVPPGTTVIVPKNLDPLRSEERRGGQGCVSTCRYRWSPYH